MIELKLDRILYGFLIFFLMLFAAPGLVSASQVITGQFDNIDGTNIDNIKVASNLNDYANILSPDDESVIVNLLSDISRESSFNLIVVTLNGLEGRDINQVANEIVDNNFKDLSDNIVLFVFSKSDRKYAFYLGKDVSGKILPRSVENIGKNSAFLFFKKGEYSKGIVEVITEFSKLGNGNIIFLESGADSVKSELGLTMIDMVKRGFFIFLILVLLLIVVSGFVANRRPSRKDAPAAQTKSDDEYFAAANYASTLFAREYQRNGIYDKPQQ